DKTVSWADGRSGHCRQALEAVHRWAGSAPLLSRVFAGGLPCSVGTHLADRCLAAVLRMPHVRDRWPLWCASAPGEASH
ncbi:MAG: hypothetical protein ACK559_03785, partial [bacterium]